MKNFMVIIEVVEEVKNYVAKNVATEDVMEMFFDEVQCLAADEASEYLMKNPKLSDIPFEDFMKDYVTFDVVEISEKDADYALKRFHHIKQLYV